MSQEETSEEYIQRIQKQYEQYIMRTKERIRELETEMINSYEQLDSITLSIKKSLMQDLYLMLQHTIIHEHDTLTLYETALNNWINWKTSKNESHL